MGLEKSQHSRGGTDYAISHNLTPFISMQNHYSMIYREEEREMFPTLKVCPSYLAQKLRTAP